MHARVSEQAPADAPAVVLVHGIGVASRYFVPTMERLAPGTRVYAPDLPGFGRSGHPASMLGLPELADALAAWMRAVGLSRAALLGNSVGCQVVAHLAVRQPNLVERLVLAGPTMDPRARSIPAILLRWQRNNRHERLAQLPVNLRDYWAAGLPRLWYTLRAALADRIEEQLPRIHVPTLVVRGEWDAIAPQDWAEEVQRLLPEATLVVLPRAAHTVNFNAPDKLAPVVLPFLTGGRAGEPPGVPAEAPVAHFDSASAMLAATANVLGGRDFPVVGAAAPRVEPVLEPVGSMINRLPRWAREQVYIWSGRQEAVPPERLGEVRAEQLARWAANHYPRRRYPAVAIGSSNGAAVHLWAALGIPWLPQTLLIPVRRSGVPPDDPRRELDWGRGPAARLLGANPDLQLHHMYDPNQDRLMVQRMAYFRVKHLRLPQAYARFLEQTLQPGGTLFVVECGLRWPTTSVAERHVFQFGALGGVTAREYLEGSPEVEAYLRRYHSPRRRWDPPEPDSERPEAEWGFEPSLRADVEALAQQQGWRVRRMLFKTPEDLSPLVADLYRWWYARLGRPSNRLLAESFVVLEPYWTLRTSSVPFWMVFNTEPSAAAIERYLASAEPAFDELGLMLFSHGVESAGLASIERWKAILSRAARTGRFIGVDERAYPRDFATVARYHAELKRHLRERYPPPDPLSLGELDTFLEEAGGRYAIQWGDGQDGGARHLSGQPE
jgi:pimeloyl-ACP methyl ester carboxylesterase